MHALVVNGMKVGAIMPFHSDILRLDVHTMLVDGRLENPLPTCQVHETYLARHVRVRMTDGSIHVFHVMSVDNDDTDDVVARDTLDALVSASLSERALVRCENVDNCQLTSRQGPVK